MANPTFNKLLQSDAVMKDQEEGSGAGKANWRNLMNKDKLTALEMMQEAAFTELLNKESL